MFTLWCEGYCELDNPTEVDVRDLMKKIEDWIVERPEFVLVSDEKGPELVVAALFKKRRTLGPKWRVRIVGQEQLTLSYEGTTEQYEEFIESGCPTTLDIGCALTREFAILAISSTLNKEPILQKYEWIADPGLD